ncbi:extracellular solute-binding protein [bacterium]|nr:MAG: extracellular solute-binding protein [bacterium]
MAIRGNGGSRSPLRPAQARSLRLRGTRLSGPQGNPMTLGMSLGLAAAAIVLAAAFVTSETSITRQAKADRVTVVYWEKWTGSEGEEMAKVVSAFNRSQDRIFVKILSISGVDQKTMLATAGGNPPDVAGLWGNNVTQLADANAVTDLTELARAAGVTEDQYIPGYWDGLTYHGKLWALPSTPASMAMHVNADLVPKEFATAETFPQTFKALDALVDKISKKDKAGTLTMTGFLPGEPGWWHWAWGYWFGGRLIEGDRLTINAPENVRALEWIAGYGKRFGVSQMQSFQSGFGNFASPQDAFMTGKVASQLHGVYKANYIRLYKSDLNWFALPFPHPDDRPDLAGQTIIDQDVLMIPRGAKHPKEAFEFIRFVQRQDVMEGLCAAHGKNSPLMAVSEGFLKDHPNKEIRLFDRLARDPKAFHTPKIGIFNQISSEMSVAYQEVSGGQKSAKQALDDAQSRLEGLWRIYQDQVLKP